MAAECGCGVRCGIGVAVDIRYAHKGIQEIIRKRMDIGEHFT
jgi:hypothetical protein